MVFFFNDTATTEIYTLSLHDALPIFFPKGHPSLRLRDELGPVSDDDRFAALFPTHGRPAEATWRLALRSEEHTSELQSRQYLACRLLLEKKQPLPLSSRAPHSDLSDA